MKRLVGRKLILELVPGTQAHSESQRLWRFILGVAVIGSLAIGAASTFGGKTHHRDPAAYQPEALKPAPRAAKPSHLTDTEIAKAQHECRENNTSACLIAANEAREFSRVQLAISNLKWICASGKNDSGTAGACYKLGLFYESPNVPNLRDPELALSYFAQACNAGHLHSCFEAASRSFWQKGDELSAFSMLRSACGRWKKTGREEATFVSMCDHVKKSSNPDEELWAKVSSAVLYRAEDGAPVYVLGRTAAAPVQQQAAASDF